MAVSWSEAQADAACFLAVVPPPAVVDEIVRIRKVAGLDTSVVPHVTIKAQPNLESPAAWQPVVRDAIAATAPFDLTLGRVGWFGDGIVFLSVSEQIVGLHRVVLEAVESVVHGARFEYEGDAFVPHLTLGATFVGETKRQLRHIANAASGKTWASFRVRSVVEFRRDRRGQEYAPAATYPLDRE
jgi:2'-5' RNA ligase